jgi:Cdc6-like AAA superfamily ATPase
VLERAIGERSFIIVLDEIDITSPKERNMIIYTLSKIPKAGLVCISESREHYMDLNERVKSRLNPKRIGFKPYSVMDLVHILEQRARLALVPNTWDKTTLERIAELAEGDARVAIQTLKNSAQYAEGDLAERIKPEHIEKGWNEAKKIKKSYILRKLTEDHRILYRIIESRGEVYSGELWRAYLNQCKSIRIKPISMRSFINYVNKLKALGLITAERARRKGKVRVFRPTD